MGEQVNSDMGFPQTGGQVVGRGGGGGREMERERNWRVISKKERQESSASLGFSLAGLPWASAQGRGDLSKSPQSLGNPESQATVQSGHMNSGRG